MAGLVKWLTRQIVALLCKGSTPLSRPIFGEIKPFGLFYSKKLGILVENPGFLYYKERFVSMKLNKSC